MADTSGLGVRAELGKVLEAEHRIYCARARH